MRRLDHIENEEDGMERLLRQTMTKVEASGGSVTTSEVVVVHMGVHLGIATRTRSILEGTFACKTDTA